MSNTKTLVELFTEIANNIRAKENTTEKISATEFPSRIGSIITFSESVSPVTISNGLNSAIEIHSFDSSVGFLKTEIKAGSTETHDMHNGIVVFSILEAAKLTTNGAIVDVIDRSVDSGAYCIGFTNALTISVSALN